MSIRMMDPRQLLTRFTFDVCAKALYGRYYVAGYATTWAKRVYLRHIDYWNGFVEKKPEPKSGPNAFVHNFERMIIAMRTGDFNWEKSPIILDDDGYVINGRHRLAAGIAANTDVGTIQGGYRNGVHGQKDASHNFFLNYKHLDEKLETKWTDAMALEYVRVKPCRVLLAFQEHDPEEMARAIERYTGLVYRKMIDLHNRGPHYLFREIYHGEQWLTPTYSGADDKASFSYAYRRPWKLGVYIIDSRRDQDVRQMKADLRTIYGGQHSLHINDTQEQTLRIARLLLNENGIHFMNHSTMRIMPKLRSLLTEYAKGVRNSEDVCLAGSTTMALYGLRDVKDLDYISNSVSGIGGASRHDTEKLYYGGNWDDIVHNPENHLWFNGIKYMSLQRLRRMKAIRMEEKDVIDVRLIDTILRRRSIYDRTQTEESPSL